MRPPLNTDGIDCLTVTMNRVKLKYGSVRTSRSSTQCGIGICLKSKRMNRITLKVMISDYAEFSSYLTINCSFVWFCMTAPVVQKCSILNAQSCMVPGVKRRGLSNRNEQKGIFIGNVLG